MSITDSIRGMFDSAPAQTHAVTVERASIRPRQNNERVASAQTYGQQPYEDPMVAKLRQYALIGLTGVVGACVVVFIIIRVIQNIIS